MISPTELQRLIVPKVVKVMLSADAHGFAKVSNGEFLKYEPYDFKIAITHLLKIIGALHKELRWIKTECSPPVYGSMCDMPTINAIWVASDSALALSAPYVSILETKPKTEGE